MKRLRTTTLFTILVLMLAGCGKQASIQQNSFEQALIGEWAYAHDLNTAQAIFKENGDATFEGKNYTYTSDGSFIHFEDRSGEGKDLQYVQKDDQMYVYIQSTYTREIGDASSGIVGVWCCKDTNWTYEFTDKGTFMEDGALTGYYYVDEEAGTIRLVYGEALEDTVFYYQLEGDSLQIAYPWLMQKIG